MLFPAGNGYLKNDGLELISLDFTKRHFIKITRFVKYYFIKP